MAYKKLIALNLFVCCLCVTGWSQQGGGMDGNSNDTLIRVKTGNTRGFKPVVNVNNFYRLHVGAAYNFINGNDSISSLTNKQTLGLNYSITEKSFHPYYRAVFPLLFGNWNLSLLAGYDGVRRVNFYGVGNESTRNPDNNRFNWLRTENIYASVGVNKTIARKHNIGFNVLYDCIRVMDDADRIVARAKGLVEVAQYKRQSFLGSQIQYFYSALNQAAIPTKGLKFSTSASYTENLQRSGHSFARLTTDLSLYLPLPKHFSAVTRIGAATVTGDPDFYQLNTIGGTNTLRGYQGFRFYGKTSFYNQNELRWIPNVETKLYKGPLGFFVLFDQGRVWQPGETSNKIHTGYGGGIILAPLNKVAITAAYALSKEDRRMHLSIRKIF